MKRMVEERFTLSSDALFERVRGLHDRAMANATPGCKEWWKKQPVNFLDETISDLFATIELGNPCAIERAFKFAESEIAMYARFHGRAVNWVEAVIRIPDGEKLCPAIVPDELLERARAAKVVL